MKNIFQGLWSIYPGNLTELQFSGFVLEKSQLPYICLNQLANTLDTVQIPRNSCGSRFERSIYQFSIYAESDDDRSCILEILQNAYNWKSFALDPPRKLTLLEYLNDFSRNPEPQLYTANLAYTIIIERSTQQTPSINETRANTLQEAIFRRYNSYLLQKSDLPNFVSDDFNLEKESWPYIRIPGFSSREGWLTSKSRINQKTFDFEIYSESLDDLLEYLEKIENLYDYCNIILPETFMMFDWQGNSIEELEPGFWLGKVNYEILQEKLINI